MRRRNAFTLVELLVVIGIIAVLIGVLLPTLAAARRSANSLACLSNVRQLAMATMLFAQEHKGYSPTCSDDGHAKAADPLRKKWSYRPETTHVDKVVLIDHYSALIPYLGGKMGQTFLSAPQGQSKVFRCPSDEWLNHTDPGYMIFSNVTGGYQPISYGYNADIGCVSDAGRLGRFGQGASDVVAVVYGPAGPAPYPVGGKLGQPLQAKLDKVYKPAEVLLFADCGTRPRIGSPAAPLDYNDSLFYTTNWMTPNMSFAPEDLGRLSGVLKTAHLKDRIPMTRHGGKKRANGTFVDAKINVAFADGHGDTVQIGDFNKVRVTPFQPR